MISWKKNIYGRYLKIYYERRRFNPMKILLSLKINLDIDYFSKEPIKEKQKTLFVYLCWSMILDNIKFWLTLLFKVIWENVLLYECVSQLSSVYAEFWRVCRVGAEWIFDYSVF